MIADAIPPRRDTLKKTLCACFGLSLIAWSIWAAVAQEPAKTAKKVADAEPNKHEATIRASVAQFVKAYNAHDAKAVSELFLAEAQIVDEDDNTIQGRAEIESLFAGVFEESPKAKIEVAIESIRFIGTALAVETGSTTTTKTGTARPTSTSTIMAIGITAAGTAVGMPEPVGTPCETTIRPRPRLD